ncbi:MAG: 3-hydroxyacyl-ACP dehydratase FabZ [Proteocatella sp.]
MENFTLPYTIKEIQQIIPHRAPFLLIDKITELDIEKGIATGYKAVSYNEPFFAGHFPQEPVMPGVLIIEALAQVGAVAVLSMEDYKGKIAFFAGIESAKFRQKVVPGDLLRLEVEMTAMRRNIGKAKAKAYVGDKLACQCELMFAIG